MADALARGDWQNAPMSDQDRELCAYVEKLTLRPAEVIAADVQNLRDAGFNDAEITDIANTTAQYAFTNRIVDGLGAELPRGMEQDAERLGIHLRD